MSLISAEISLSPAEIAYEPNDGHLEKIKKVIKIICRNNFKECFEFNFAVLRRYWAYWDILEPNDGQFFIFSEIDYSNLFSWTAMTRQSRLGKFRQFEKLHNLRNLENLWNFGKFCIM